MVFRFDEKLKDPHLHPITTEFINLEQPPNKSLARRLFEVLSTVCEIETNETCGMYIHITPGRGALGIWAVKEPCRNIIYFESMIESLAPRHRVENDLMVGSR
ncbi:amidoligase enzyme-domain-containing protein [Penicillium expansum]|nr:amidoligase enzyme-domain-containing protein [Penicillium expansum]